MDDKTEIHIPSDRFGLSGGQLLSTFIIMPCILLQQCFQCIELQLAVAQFVT